jgi:hypothetical protein
MSPVPTGAPTCFSESCGICIVLHRNLSAEETGKVLDDIAALPAGKKIHVANHSREGVDRAGASDADSRDRLSRLMRDLAQQMRDALKSALISKFSGGWRLDVREHEAVIVD